MSDGVRRIDLERGIVTLSEDQLNGQYALMRWEEYERLRAEFDREGRMRERAVDGQIAYKRRLDAAEKRIEELEDLLSNPREHDHLGEYDSCPTDTQREHEYKTVDIENIGPEPVYATLSFYESDPESMAMFHRMLKVDGLYSAVQEFDNWLRNRIKYNPDPGNPLHIPDDGIDYLIIAREQLAMRLADYDINIWED